MFIPSDEPIGFPVDNFQSVTRFIDKNKEEPFFVYLPLNAPHDPLIVAEKYAAPYKKLEGKDIISANLYGMIANM